MSEAPATNIPRSKETAVSAGILRILLYCAAAVMPLAVIVLSAASSGHGAVEETGKAFALTGFMIVAMQPVLAGRFGWITRAFGLDIVLRYHRVIALFGGGLIVLHPLLIAAAEGEWKLLIGLDLPWYIWLGKGALAVLVIHLGVSVFQKHLNLSFETWRLSHAVLAPVLLAGAFIHSTAAGGDFDSIPLLILWSIVLAAALSAYVFHKFIRPARLKQQPWTVRTVKQEAHRVWTVDLAPPPGASYAHRLPGQFHFITFHRSPDLPEEEHHWTISSSPAAETVASTIKESGDFTSTIGHTRPGDTATVHGAFGRFSYVFHPNREGVVCIAGGIGITPIMSMLRHMRDTGDSMQTLLLYASRTEKDIVFREELDSLTEALPSFTVMHVVSRPGGDWPGERGHIDRSTIERLCSRGLLDKAHFYICGPPGLRTSVLQNLKALGVTDSRMHTELFSFI